MTRTTFIVGALLVIPASAMAQGRDLNSVPVAAIDSVLPANVKRLYPDVASQILVRRDRAPFTAWEQVDSIRGVGKATLARLRAAFSIEGAPEPKPEPAVCPVPQVKP